MSLGRLTLVLAVLSLVSLALAGPNGVSIGGVCPCGTPADPNPYNILKPEGNGLVADNVPLECCDGAGCFDPRMDECHEPNEKYFNGGDKIICNKHWGAVCNAGCINTMTQICTSAKAVNGKYYIERAGTRNLVQGLAIKVIAVPLFGIFFGLISFAASLLTLRHTFSTLTLVQKVTVLLCLPIVIFNFFMYFGSNDAYKFAVFVQVLMCLTVIAIGVENKFLNRFMIAFHVYMLIYLVGPNLGGNSILSAGNGLIDAVGSCGGSQGWTNHWTIQNPGPDSAVTSYNPNDTYWGFCAPGFLTWQALVALFIVTLEFFVFVFFISNSAPPLGSGLAEPLLK